jgi:hypothetical protein
MGLSSQSSPYASRPHASPIFAMNLDQAVGGVGFVACC